MNKSFINKEELKPRFKIGSSVFFSQYKDFIPGDTDELEFEENPKLYKYFLQFRKTDKTRCFFKWKKMSAEDFVEYSLNSKTAMEIGKFLVPEVAEYLGFTIEHLKQLEPVVDKLDDRHKYEKIIFQSYLENNAFYLTQSQRDLAYEEYKKYRR